MPSTDECCAMGHVRAPALPTQRRIWGRPRRGPPRPPPIEMLRIQNLHAGYGATPILFGVSLEVNEGEAVALLGKNGMGKTTLMKTAMGFVKPTGGPLDFEGSDLARLPPHEPHAAN